MRQVHIWKLRGLRRHLYSANRDIVADGVGTPIIFNLTCELISVLLPSNIESKVAVTSCRTNCHANIVNNNDQFSDITCC